MTDLSTFIQAAGATAWAWDASRGNVDIVTADGHLYGYNVASHGFTMSMDVGGTPGSVDVSVDGAWLIIGNSRPIVTSSPIAFTTTYANQVTRVNLATHAADTLQYASGDGYGGVTAVAIAADGTALVGTGNQWQQLRTFNIAAANPSFQSSPGTYYPFSFFPSADHKMILMRQDGISDGPVSVFSSGSDTITASTDLYQIGTSGYNRPHGGGAIDTAGKLVVDQLGSNVYVFDTSLHPVANLSNFTSGATGAVFTQGAHNLLVWKGASHQIQIFDTSNWTQVGTMSVPTIPSAPLATSTGLMQVVDGGRLLLLDSSSGVQVVDLSTQLTTGLAITARPGGDALLGFAGNDTLASGAGNDSIEGGGGWNTAVFAGSQASYTVTHGPDGSLTVTDLRSGSPDGVDHLAHIQTLKFADASVALGPTSVANQIDLGFSTVLRETSPTAADAAAYNSLQAQASAGTLTMDQAASAIVHQAATTASVATIAYQYFTGSAPSAAGMDYLVSPTGPNPNNLNSAYYQSFNLENRYINFAVNLGAGQGAGASAFAAVHASQSLSQTLVDAYTAIFGPAPTADKISHLLNDLVPNGLGGMETRTQYFADYGRDGPNGVGTKAAMVGWLMAEAVKADTGVYAHSNDAFLTDVALHNAPFGVDIIGHYNQPSFVYAPG